MSERQKISTEERVKITLYKMAPLNLDADVKAKTAMIIKDFYETQQKSMQEMRASGSMDRDAMKAKRKELTDAREEKLKMIFTQAQMQQWIDVIEPSLRPKKGVGQRNNG